MDVLLISLGTVIVVLITVLVILIVTIGRSKKKQTKETISSQRQQYENVDNDYNTYAIKKPINTAGSQALKIPKLSESEKTGILNQAPPVKANETELLGSKGKGLKVTLSYEFEGKEYNFVMDSNFINIGRDPEQCDMIISHDSYIGRNHAIIYNKNNNFYLVDLASSNGTFINAKRVFGAVKINDGDVFKLANTEIVLQINKQ